MIPKWYQVENLSRILSRMFRQPVADLPVLLILWTILSAFVSLACSYSFIHPYWLLHPDHIHSFGVYNHCYNHPNRNRRVCECFGGRFSFSNVPSEAWQATCVLFGSGCVLMFASTLCAALGLCFSRPCEQYLTVIGGGLQITAAITLLSGVVVYPLGTNSSVLRYYCGAKGPYHAGHCTLGWAFVTAVTGSALAVFCPLIAYFVDTKTPPKDTQVLL